MSAQNIIEPKACKVLQVKHETAQEVTFRIAYDEIPNHGQFLQLSLPKIGEVPISIANFGPGWLEFTVRAVGRVTDRLFAVRPDDTLFARGSYGNGWPMESLLNKHLVVICGGTGMAPVRSLLQMALINQEAFKSVSLVAGFRNSDSILYQEELTDYVDAGHFNTVLTLDNQEFEGFQQGFVTAHLDKIAFSKMEGDYQVIVVGPPAMMHHTSQSLLQHNIPEEKIWLSFERRMSCAVGKCGHCRIDEVYVCLNGPVFNYTQAKYLLD